MINIGFIGMGVMGAPMAGHLADAGHSIVTSLNTSPLPATLEGKNVEVVETPSKVAEKSDVVIVMVPDSPDVERVISGENGLLESLSEGMTVIDMSSISPVVTAELAEKVRAKGADYLDAPVSGGVVGAEAASLTIMVGGAKAVFEKAKPLFEIMGKNITLIGEQNGAGQTCKIANQIIVALNIEAVSEALVFASKAGCDPAVVREALMGGFASSKILEVHGERMIKRTFDPGFRVSLHKKDLNLALQAADSLGVDLPNTSKCQELFTSLTEQGLDEDHSSLVKAIEALADHQVA